MSWIVDQGSDFPAELRVLIDQWGTSCHFRTDLNRLTTRAWNGYGENEHRCESTSGLLGMFLTSVAFKYLTPKLRLEEHDLSDDQVLGASFHMVCSPKRCITLIEGIRARRSKLRPGFPPPIFVWEPVPDLCTPRELENLQQAARYVDVVSPNGEELAQFFSEAVGKADRLSMIESMLATAGGLYGPVSVVVRDGADGCRLYLEGKVLHLRAYHQNGVGVVDPTGGGNTYLGALATGLTRAVTPNESFLDDQLFSFGTKLSIKTPRLRRHILAAIHATVAASFAIEQVGTPSLAGHEEDCWNGTMYQDRFAEYLERERSHILQQLDKLEDRN